MWENEDLDIEGFYEFTQNPKDKSGGDGVVKLTAGPFEGLIYKYGGFRFTKPKEDEDEPSVQYEFDVLHIPEEIVGVEYPDEMKESFEILLAKILIDIVMKQVEKDKREEHDSTNGKSDIDESFKRRVVQEFDNPVPEE